MLRIGCLGAARIAPTALLLPAKDRDDVSVTAVASRSGERGRAFAEEHGIEGVETDYAALIARDDVDLIYNALPPSRHEELTVLALKAGKPVLCEKPFAMNAEQAARMAAVARETGVLLMEAFHYRFHPAFIQAFDIVKGGDLGRIKSASAKFSVPIPETEGELRHDLALGGGALMDLGCYPVHWIRTLLEGAPDIASATAVHGLPGIDISMEADLIFDGGVAGKVACSMMSAAKRTAGVKVVGADAVLKMRNPIAPHKGYLIEILPQGAEEPIIVAEADASKRTTYDYQLDHFINCVHGQAEPIITPEDSVANMEVIDGIYRAADMSPRGL